LQSSGPNHCAAKSPRQAARRKQIADTARLLFADRGFQNTRITQISAAAGIKVGQIYRDFDSKEAIFAEIVRNDLARYLDVSALDQAIASGDPRPVRQWLSDFIQHDSEPSKGRLMAHIMVEAGRNECIAALFQRASQCIRSCVDQALAAIAPGCARQAARGRLVEIIMVMLMGLPQRRIAVPDTDVKAVAANISQLVERELDWLTADDVAASDAG
jgi:AcrR family transcriptional regulator